MNLEKQEIIDYLKSELEDLKSEYDAMEIEYDNAKHMDRIGMAMRREKITDKYYHFWMVCNDLGIVNN